MKPTVDKIREIKLLQTLTEPELGKLLTVGQPLQFEAHTNVVIEGELSWGLYLIMDGVVGIYKNNKLTGESYDVGQLRAGSFFGEMSLVDDNPRSATVRTLTDSVLFHLSKEDFHRFLAQSSDLKLRFYEACVRNIVARLRELDDNYVVSQYQLWKSAFKKESA